MGAQGYDIKQNILLQDNQSAINNEKNRTCTGNSKHIDIHYFFAKDQFESNNTSIEYFSTEHMLVDFLQSPYKELCLRNFAKWSWYGKA